jgi:hypothetical protein
MINKINNNTTFIIQYPLSPVLLIFFIDKLIQKLMNKPDLYRKGSQFQIYCTMPPTKSNVPNSHPFHLISFDLTISRRMIIRFGGGEKSEMERKKRIETSEFRFKKIFRL